MSATAYPRDFGAGQFLLGPTGRTSIENWTTVPVAEGFEVSAHQELPVVTAEGRGGSVTLVGYVVDPRDPRASTEEILERLAAVGHSDGDLASLTDGLVGRYILIVIGHERKFVLPDAVGGRQLVTAVDQRDSSVWAASSPTRLATHLGLSVDPAAADFEGEPAFRNMRGGRWWPHDRTRYRGCRRLLPNHSLDLTSGTLSRVFPTGSLTCVGVEAAGEVLRRTVRGGIVAMAARAPLTLLVTAGSDSRLLLAAARPVADQMRFVSIATETGMDEDVLRPAEFCASLGLTHCAVVAERQPTADFWRRYLEQGGPANEGYAANAEAMMRATQDRVAITGHVAGVFKAAYGGARFARRVTGGRLAMETHMGTHPFAARAFGDWVADAPAGAGYRLHDLAYWEQRVGSWVSGWALEYDIAWRDVLLPFASRELLRTLLGSPAACRVGAPSPLYRSAIAEWWPELLDWPAGGNPQVRRGLLDRTRRSLRYVAARR